MRRRNRCDLRPRPALCAVLQSIILVARRVSWSLQGTPRSFHYRLPRALRVLCVLPQREFLRTVGHAVETSKHYVFASVNAAIAIRKVKPLVSSIRGSLRLE